MASNCSDAVVLEGRRLDQLLFDRVWIICDFQHFFEKQIKIKKRKIWMSEKFNYPKVREFSVSHLLCHNEDVYRPEAIDRLVVEFVDEIKKTSDKGIADKYVLHNVLTNHARWSHYLSERNEMGDVQGDLSGNLHFLKNLGLALTADRVIKVKFVAATRLEKVAATHN